MKNKVHNWITITLAVISVILFTYGKVKIADAREEAAEMQTIAEMNVRDAEAQRVLALENAVEAHVAQKEVDDLKRQLEECKGRP